MNAPNEFDYDDEFTDEENLEEEEEMDDDHLYEKDDHHFHVVTKIEDGVTSMHGIPGTKLFVQVNSAVSCEAYIKGNRTFYKCDTCNLRPIW